MRKILKYSVLAVTVLFTVFYTSYVVTNIRKEYNEKQKNILFQQSEKEKVLDNNLKVSLFSGDVLENEKSLKEVKSDLKLSDNLTEEDLDQALLTLGYSLEEKSGNDYVYKREPSENAAPNKYYIKEYEGYLAIFKTDKDGKLYIEDQDKDVYRQAVKFDDLPEGDKELINNMQLVYDNKEDAKLDITDIIS